MKNKLLLTFCLLSLVGCDDRRYLNNGEIYDKFVDLHERILRLEIKMNMYSDRITRAEAQLEILRGSSQ